MVEVAQGDVLHSYTMLTINADEHPLMKQFHKPTDEKRMVVILPENRYDEWLRATADQSAAFMELYPSKALQSSTSMPGNLRLF